MLDYPTRIRKARRLNRQLELHESGARRMSRSEFVKCQREIAECKDASEKDLISIQSAKFTAFWNSGRKD